MNCVCGHAKTDHIYHEGRCNWPNGRPIPPGRLMQSCACSQFRPEEICASCKRPDSEHRDSNGQWQPCVEGIMDTVRASESFPDGRE